MDQKITEALCTAYNRAADERNKLEVSPWKASERQAYLEMLQREGKETLLEIGAGPGHDSLFFQENGLLVTSTDLSPQMVRLCRSKGLEAYEMDFFDLGFTDSQFDALYALNCLLHVPKIDLGDAMLEIRRVMAPGGLFFLGVYGGIEHEGTWEEDKYIPKRFFAFYPDEQIRLVVKNYFLIRDFKKIDPGDAAQSGLYFQRLILQKELD